MAWINALFILVLFDALIGALSYSAFQKRNLLLEEQAAYSEIYRNLRRLPYFFILPGIILAICNSNLRFFLLHPALSPVSSESVPLKTIFFAAAVVWLAGALFIGIRRSLHYYGFRKICRHNQKIDIPELSDYFKEICARQDYYCTVWAYENEIIQVPVIFGIKKKYILFPKDHYTSQEIRIILEHELVHAKHHDLLLKRLVLILCTVFWFIPAPKALLKAINDWCETACDIELCAAAHSRWTQREYFEPIVQRACRQTAIRPDVALTLTGDLASTKRRMIRIQNYTAPHHKTAEKAWTRRRCIALLSLLLIGSVLSTAGNRVFGTMQLPENVKYSSHVQRHPACVKCETLGVSRTGGRGYPVYLTAETTIRVCIRPYGNAENTFMMISFQGIRAGNGPMLMVQNGSPADRVWTATQSGWYRICLNAHTDGAVGATVIFYR